MKNIIIMGYGEVGQAVAQMYVGPYNVQIADPATDYPTPNWDNIDVLNVCIPYSDKFVQIVGTLMRDIAPELTIIHSTVPPGTTEKVRKASEFDREVVHSPVRGVHPNLLEGLKTFTKYIGGDTLKSLQLAMSHLSALGYKISAVSSSRVTEVGKLLSTSYYGVAIAWHEEMKNICEQFDVPFEQTVTQFNESYNEGYLTLGMPHVTRPTLLPPDGPIGGHCVVPNAKLLKEAGAKSDGLDMILECGKDE